MQSMEDRLKYLMGDLLLSNVRSQQEIEQLREELERAKKENE